MIVTSPRPWIFDAGSKDSRVGAKFKLRIDILLPNCKECPKNIEACLGAQFYYKVINMDLRTLIKPEFIEAFVKKGKLYLMSIGTYIDAGICIAVLPTGLLLLHVDKDTYESLGLEGKQSEFNNPRSKLNTKYVISIDLKAKHFRPEKKNYQNIEKALSERLKSKFNVILSWVPPDDNVCPSSVSAYFTSLGYTCNLCFLEPSFKLLVNPLIPTITCDEEGGTETACDQESFYEWLGAVACDIDCSTGSPDGFVSTLCVPEPSKTVSRCTRCGCSGFITPKCIMQVLQHLRESVTEMNLPWGSMTIHGFMDSPVSWGTREHGYLRSGDNLYSFIVFPDGGYWIYSALGILDICP